MQLKLNKEDLFDFLMTDGQTYGHAGINGDNTKWKDRFIFY